MNQKSGATPPSKESIFVVRCWHEPSGEQRIMLETVGADSSKSCFTNVDDLIAFLRQSIPSTQA